METKQFFKRKTVIKRLYKYIPKNDRSERVAEAIEIDNQEYSITTGQSSYLESLLQTANLPEDELALLQEQIPGMSFAEAQAHIERLKENQLNPVTHGLNPTQAQISAHIKSITQ